MSGPVSTSDVPPSTVVDRAVPCELEVVEGREATVGDLGVRRILPRRGRRAVGPWCFADHMGPAAVTAERGLDIGPHPHIGLQTVTWLVAGEVLHRDSLGSEQVVRPGQLNLMTAGRGVSHSEEATGSYAGDLHGIQLWVAQPAATRDGEPAFEHHDALPQVEYGDAVATVLVGELGDTLSPARRDTPLVGADLALHDGSAVLPLRRDWEHGLVVLRGGVSVDDRFVGPGRLAYLGQGRDELVLDAVEPTRLVLLGGEPLDEKIMMWWNFVGRSRDELDSAYRSWQAQDDRFGRVASALPRIPAPPPHW